MAVGPKKARVATAKHVAALTVCATAATASPRSGSASGSVYILVMASLSTLGFFNDLNNTMSRFSPHYNDIAPHGGSTRTPLSLTYEERRHQGHGDDVAFTGCRGLLEFGGGAGTPFDGMPTRGEEEAADEDGEEVKGDEEDDDEGKEGEGEEEEKDDEGGIEAEDGIRVPGKKKQKKVVTGARCPKWKDLKDQCMCYSLKTVSIDTVTGANKKHCAYWARIKAEYDECKYLNNDYTMIIGGVR
jgi:hypothetical protein